MSTPGRQSEAATLQMGQKFASGAAIGARSVSGISGRLERKHEKPF